MFNTMYSDSRLLNIHYFVHLAQTCPSLCLVSSVQVAQCIPALQSILKATDQRNTSAMENHLSVFCVSTCSALKPVHPHEHCELHFQVGVATAAAGDCSTALMGNRK